MKTNTKVKLLNLWLIIVWALAVSGAYHSIISIKRFVAPKSRTIEQQAKAISIDNSDNYPWRNHPGDVYLDMQTSQWYAWDERSEGWHKLIRE